MLNYLRAKREALEAQRKEAPIVDEEIERAVEEYRARLYKERFEQVTEQNKAIDAKLEILDEVIAETERAIEETVNETVNEAVDNDAGEVDEVVDESVYNEQKESDI